MADDAAAPEGELTESSDLAEESGTVTPDGTTESPEALDAEVPEPTEGADGAEDTEIEDSAFEDGAEGEPEAAAELPDGAVAAPPKRTSGLAMAVALGLVVAVALAGLVGWLGWRGYQAHAAERERAEFISVGKQAAINLTTIDFERADEDVKRILDSATDQFYDDFAKRSQPFVDVVKQAQAKSVGEVTEAGLESLDGDTAQVLVAVTVKATNAGVPEQSPRFWRMRVSVKKVDDQVKVANVGFVP